MAQWIKDLTAGAQVAAEVQWVKGSGIATGRYSGLKDLALPRVQHGLQLWVRFNFWMGTSMCHGRGCLKKKKKTELNPFSRLTLMRKQVAGWYSFIAKKMNGN